MTLRLFSIGLGLALLLAACTVRSAPQVQNQRATVGESLGIKMAPAAVPEAIRAMQADSAIDDPQTGVRIAPWTVRARTTRMQSEAYVLALADAREKALALAQRLGVALGPVSAISEMTPNARGGYADAWAASRGAEKASMNVNGPANGIVTLAVTYNAGTTPISVFGVHSAAPEPATLGDADGVIVTINARGETFAVAGQRMRAVESAVRAIAQRYHANVTVTDADANAY
jgi:hypothetical protein